MVFFSCGACGTALKKNQVENHCLGKCIAAQYVSCLDCNKEFWGDSYKEHIKCISEKEKYSGKDYKPSANKGERKQESWNVIIGEAAKNAPNNPKVKEIFDILFIAPGVPRKKGKFENFLRNQRVYNHGLINQVWELISSAQLEKQKTAEQEEKQVAAREPKEASENCTAQDATESKDDKLSKKERKKLRKQKQHKDEKKDKTVNGTENVDEDKSSSKKKKNKRKHSEENGNETDNEVSEPNKKKKKKNRHDQEKDNETDNEVSEPNKKKKKKNRHNQEKDNDTEAVTEQKKKKKKQIHVQEEYNEQENINGDTEKSEGDTTSTGKFVWEAVIIGALQHAEDKELSIKKLRKKVMAEFTLRGEAKGKSEEKLLAKFTKKINKNSRLKVHKDRVKLIG